MNQLEKLLEEYFKYLEIEKNRSHRTVESYKRYLSTFLKITQIKNLSQLNLKVIRNFRLALARKTNQKGELLNKRTQSYYVIALRSFLKYLAKNGIFPPVTAEQIELPKIPQRQIEIINYNDLERFLNSPCGDSLKAARDKAILETLFSTGLRVSELCSLSRYQNFERGEITVRGKGGKLRIVFLSSQAKKAIENYLSKRNDTQEALFVSLTKSKPPKVIGRITPRAVQRIVKHYGKKAGILDKMTPHQLRHQFATDLLANGADIRAVQILLGHTNIATTQIYTHITNKELKEVHRAFHGKRRK